MAQSRHCSYRHRTQPQKCIPKQMLIFILGTTVPLIFNMVALGVPAKESKKEPKLPCSTRLDHGNLDNLYLALVLALDNPLDTWISRGRGKESSAASVSDIRKCAQCVCVRERVGMCPFPLPCRTQRISSLDGRNLVIVIAESQSRFIATIQITSVRSLAVRPHPNQHQRKGNTNNNSKRYLR